MGVWYRRWDVITLAVILLALFGLRLSLAVSVESLNFDSYLTVRHVENILETGKPITEDPLSVTGHTRLGGQFFRYLLAIGVNFSPWWYKILPNLCMVLALIPVFFLTRRITDSKPVALLAAVLAGTGPLVFAHGLIAPVASTLAIGLFLAILSMLPEPEKHVYWILGCAILLTFLHPLVFILVFSLLATLILLRLEGFGIDRRVSEMFVFTLFLASWFTVITYKKALLTEGVRILWQNLPLQYAQTSFGSVTGVTLLYGLGVLTFLFGVIGIYHVLFENRIKEAYPVIGANIATAFALLAGLVPIETGVVVLSALLAIMAGHGILLSFHYLQRTRVPWSTWPFAACLILLFVLTSVFPALGNAQDQLQDAPTAQQIEGYRALNDTLPPNSVLLTTVREGAIVQHLAGVRTLTDQDFLLVENSEELVNDIDGVYAARFNTALLRKTAKLGVTHILFSTDAQRQYDRKEILVSQSECLTQQTLPSGMILYTVRCGGGSDA